MGLVVWACTALKSPLSNMTNRFSVTSILLLIGAGFFIFEAIIHTFGLAILEHDKIFLFTHDRYIALYAITMTALIILAATDIRRYRILFFIVMVSVLLGGLNAMLIARLGGYEVLFPAAVNVDGQLSGLGVGAAIWYVTTWLAFVREVFNFNAKA
jgi:hypothetical protein